MLHPIHAVRQLWNKLRQPPATPAPATLPPPSTKAFAIREVLARELQQVRSLCAARNVRDSLHRPSAPGKQTDTQAPEQFGVCFSGGGIRSASVNLGTIQALARSGFLRQVHYLSGVSGGGYILGWLTAWTARAGFDAVESQLQADSAWPKNQLPDKPGFRRFLEPNPIHYLRRYVSYLVPSSGFGSGDTLAAIAIYLRNALLMQCTVWGAITGLLALLQMIAPDILWAHVVLRSSSLSFCIIIAVLLGALALAIWIALDQLARNEDPPKRRIWSQLARGFGFTLGLFLWLALPWYVQTTHRPPAWLHLPPRIGPQWPLILAALCIFLFFILEWPVRLIQRLRLGAPELLRSVSPQTTGRMRLLAAVGSAVLGAAMLAGFRRWLMTGTRIEISDWYAILGLPAIFLAACLISFLHVGLYGDSMPDGKREWLGRLAGFYLYFATIAAGVLFIALFGPASMQWLFSAHHATWKGTLLKWILPGGWLATTLSGLFAARSPRTGQDSGGRLTELLANIAPPVFLFGVMMLASWGTHSFAVARGGPEYLTTGYAQTKPTPPPPAGCCRQPDKPPEMSFHWAPQLSIHAAPQAAWTRLLAIGISGLIFAYILSHRIKVNEFSLHLFYRNRLVRTFLGASNIDARTQASKRKPDPFTGFTLDDDHYLGSLRQGKYDGPYPLWCTALNLTTGEDLAWQKRKAASFIYSPLFCGWDYMPTPTSTTKSNAYREVAACTEDGRSNGEGYGGCYGAPLIGTAMAASGAAVSPNWGFHTRPAIAALLTLFNIRIGWWTGNPRRQDSYTQYAPGAGYLLSELAGSANENSKYVYLSDGGHFENLGLYELVRRRVKYIIACDADADPLYTFGDLSNAIEKCRVDFGVQIEMGAYNRISPDPKSKLSATHFAVGLIHYLPQNAAEAANGTEPGILLYIKSSLTGDEPAQVLGQHSATSVFPHDTTLNQFFNETQFETYRALGEHMATSLFDKYGVYRRSRDAEWPLPGAMTRDARADAVRTFFESFLRDEFRKTSPTTT